jgi:ribonuclease HI
MIAYIDGGARGNPGPAAYAVVVEATEGKPLESFSGFLGEATNNEAEYRGLLAALEYAHEQRVRDLKVVSDSELLVRQIRRAYKVKSQALKPLYDRAVEMIARLESFSIVHVPRERNREADRLVNETLDAAVAGKEMRPAANRTATPREIIRARARYAQGALRFRDPLPLGEGEEVEVDIHRKS